MSFNSSTSSSTSSSCTKSNKSNTINTVEEILSKFNIKHTHIETLTDSINNNNSNFNLNEYDDDELRDLLAKYKDECSLTFDNTEKIKDEQINSSTYNHKKDKKINVTREKDIQTEDTNSSNNPDSLLDEEYNNNTIPIYKLRAEQENLTLTNNSICDWIKAPALYVDEQEISELTYDQIKFTLDYFILSGYRVSQMTKTYYDIEAVTKLLDEKEKDLELAATIGKQLLEKDQQLEFKIEILENELEKTSEMVNQLKHEITLKDNLLKTFIESENDYEELNRSRINKNVITVESINEYKKKISSLENENEQLRNKADFYEKETKELESKESLIVQNCVNELQSTQSTLRVTQNELKIKTVECKSQQDQIQNLFSQIFELQLKIKTLKKDNSDLQSINESSINSLLNQLTDLKEKYNECLSILAKTQDELSSIRFRNQQKKQVSVGTLTSHSYTSYHEPINANDSSTLTSDDDFSNNILINYSKNEPLNIKNNHSQLRQSSSMFSPWMPVATNSFAAELYSTLNKDIDKTYLYHQASQSSEFIKQVKQKLRAQVPGSRFESQDSDYQQQSSTKLPSSQDSFENSIQLSKGMYNKHYSKTTTLPPATPDSMLSTGSSSIYSNLIGRSSSLFVLPEKLQIVKPIEGSQTLQHWQQLARPNLGCLFESRPGVSVVAMKSDSSNESLNKIDTKEFLNTKIDEYEDYDDNNYDDGYQDYEDQDIEEDFNYFYQNKSQTLLDVDDPDDEDIEMLNYINRKPRVLSPLKVELLTKLLETEEQNQNIDDDKNNNELTQNDEDSPNFFTNFFRSISTRYFKSSENIKDNFNNQNDNNDSNKISKKNKSEFDDPDTPPSSPINVPNSESTQINNNNNNLLFDVFESAKLKCKSYFYRGKFAPTPPGTPTAGIELENYLNSVKNNNNNNNNIIINNHENDNNSTNQKSFFDQIINKLNLFSSFNKTAHESKPQINNPVECNIEEDSFDKEIEQIFANNNNNKIEKESLIEMKCNTPPPSPTKSFSPPLPDMNNGEDEEYDQEMLKKSAFVKLSTLNPHINKSIDLSSLLGSLTSLKRSNKLYYNH